jgi:hypothetical protein
MELDETHRGTALFIEIQNKCVKYQYNKHVKPCVFSEGHSILLYEMDCDLMGDDNFDRMWCGPYIFKRVLEKGAYDLVDYDGIPLGEPRNGIYLKKYYA